MSTLKRIFTMVLAIAEIMLVFSMIGCKDQTQKWQEPIIIDGDYKLFYKEKNSPVCVYGEWFGTIVLDERDDDLEGYVIVTYRGNDENLTVPTVASDGKPIVGIGRWAFCKNTSIKSITIPNGIVAIHSYAFTGDLPLESVYIGATVRYISSYGTFSGGNIQNLYVDSANEKFESKGNCIIEKESRTLISGCNGSIIPNGVKKIAEGAFTECKSLQTITIPDSVEEICCFAFDSCTSLSYVYIGLNVSVIGWSAFKLYSEGTIACAAEEKPDGWDTNWAGPMEKWVPHVEWGVSREEISP